MSQTRLTTTAAVTLNLTVLTGTGTFVPDEIGGSGRPGSAKIGPILRCAPLIKASIICGVEKQEPALSISSTVPGGVGERLHFCPPARTSAAGKTLTTTETTSLTLWML